MEWNFKDGIPIYSQIIEQMKIRIASGAYRPGEKLPSVRDLAVDAGVNPNTMQKSLQELEREGLLHSERTKGRFVTEEEKTLDDLKKSLGQAFIEELFSNLEGLGMTTDEIIEAVRTYGEES